VSDYDIASGRRKFTATVQDANGALVVILDGRPYRVDLELWVEPAHFHLSVDGSSRLVAIERAADGLRITVGYDQHRLQVTPRVPIPQRGDTARYASTDVRVVAPMPGVIVAVQASLGSRIEEGAPVVIMEAMKMQMEIRATRAGRVSSISVQPGQEVAKGQILATLKTG
jgi:biotin carboxyl carrier protein